MLTPGRCLDRHLCPSSSGRIGKRGPSTTANCPRTAVANASAMAPYRPDPKILTLGPDFYDAVEPAKFPNAPRASSTRAGRSASGWSSMKRAGKRISAASSRCPTTSPQPLALRYHGHQFRVYNPEIGDGRGFPFAQLRDERGRLLDLGTKGSGQTPYSRHADGRLTLKGGVREVLATEMLEALGVNTSKSFALFETGEELERGDEPSPTRSAVLTRLSHGHIRIGTFQRLAFFGEVDNLDEARPLLPRQPLRRAGRGRPRMRCACSTSSARRPRGSPRPTSPPASSTACSTATISTSPARASTTARGGSRPTGTRTSPPPISTITGSMRSAGSRRRSTGTSRSSPAACRSSPKRRRLSDLLAGWSGPLRGGAGRGHAAAARRRAGDDDDRELAAALIKALAIARRADRPRLLRLARRPRSRAEAYPAEAFRALAKAARRPQPRRQRTHIGRTRRPARCTSRRSKRSGRRLPSATTGSRSRTRLAADPPHGRSDGAGCTGSLTSRLASRAAAVAASADVSTDPATGRARLVGRDRRCRGRGRGGARAWPEWAAHSLAYRIEALRRFANVVRTGGDRVRRADLARNRQAVVGSEDRGRRGRQQGRDFDRRLCRAHAAAEARGRARQQDRGPPQAAWRARGARPVQFPGAPAQRPHRPGADRRQCGRLQAVGEDARDAAHSWSTASTRPAFPKASSGC